MRYIPGEFAVWRRCPGRTNGDTNDTWLLLPVDKVLRAPGFAAVASRVGPAGSTSNGTSVRSQCGGQAPDGVVAPERSDFTQDRAEATRELRRALARDELFLEYQPQVALDSDRIVGVEALVRWQHPVLGIVPPLEFIPLAEEIGLIVAIGSWVIEEACREAARWRRSFPDRPTLVVSVNVSARQFGPGLVDVVTRALSAGGAEPAALCLELTEGLLMQNIEEAIAILQEFADLGVSISIDDFGTGYSALAYLKRLPLHELKIDKSFVDGLGIDDDDTAIVAAIVAVSHALDLWVVAEGVETAAQLQRLRTLGCDEVQGYYLARPGPPGAVDVMLRAEASLGWHSHEPHGLASPARSETYRPNRILVVDDDPTVRRLVRMSLTTVGFEVDEAVDGAGALAAAKRFTPDCILLDLAMPGGSGLEVCRALRAAPAAADCAILILTSTADVENKVEAFLSGADDYINKPFSPRGLVSRVHDAMRRRREEVGAPVVREKNSPGDGTVVGSPSAADFDAAAMDRHHLGGVSEASGSQWAELRR